MTKEGGRSQSFGKEEHLCRRDDIRRLLAFGERLLVHPLLFRYMLVRDGAPTRRPHQILLSVPKRRVSSAVQRNLLRRRNRVAYRTQKCMLYDNLPNRDFFLLIACIYVADKATPYEVLRARWERFLRRLREHCQRRG